MTPGTPRHFAWQAWHNVTSSFVLRGRRGTISHPPSFRVAGVALMALCGVLGLAWSPVTPGTPRHFAWQAWHNLTSTFHVAGVAQSHIHHRFASQAWHSWHWVARLDWHWSPVTPGTPRHFAWQAWHNLTTSQKNVCTVAHSRHFHTHHLSHPTLSHIHTCMHACIQTYIHTYSTYVRTYMHTIFSHTFTHSLSPPPLSFLPSPSPLQPLKLSILRS